MFIQWLPLIVGLALGLIPPRALIKGEVRYLFFEDLWTKAIKPSHGGPRRRRWWKLPLVWIDPFRGYATAYYVADAFTLPVGVSGLSPYPNSAAITVTLSLCLWIQTFGRRSFDETISPMSFLGGMVLVLLPLEVAIPVLVVGLASVVAVRDYAYGYYAGALACAGFGFFFMGSSHKLFAPMALILLPVIVNWMRRSMLVVPVRC